MNVIIIILLVLAGIIALVLIIALFMKRNHYIKCEIIVDVPSQQAYDFLKLLKNQEKFNKWASAGGERKIETKGADGTVGYVYAWSGDKKAGVGAKEILNLIEGKRIETEIRFEKPFRTSASVIMETESLPGDKTRVSLSNAGILNYPLNILIPLLEKNFPKDMDISLSTLKNILENNQTKI